MHMNKDSLPQFETEEQEAEYWDTHSPLDLIAEPKAQKVRTGGTKDRPITIRLDSDSRLKLKELATEQGLGPSTLARLILMASLDSREKLPKVEVPDGINHEFEDTSPPSAKGHPVDGKTARSISTAQMELHKAHTYALDGDWQAALSLSNQAVANLPVEYLGDIKHEIRMVWSVVQHASIRPLLMKADNSVSDWNYDDAISAIKVILSICEAAHRALDYTDLSIGILRIAHSTCKAAGMWKEDIDVKLDKCVAGVAMLTASREPTADKKMNETDFLDEFDSRINRTISYKERPLPL